MLQQKVATGKVGNLFFSTFHTQSFTEAYAAPISASKKSSHKIAIFVSLNEFSMDESQNIEYKKIWKPCSE